MFLVNFLHNYNPQPILLRLGFWNVHWYGLLISCAIFLGLVLIIKIAPSYKYHFQNIVFNIVIFGFIGARIYYVANEFSYYYAYPFEIFKIWEGGLGIYGAVIGGALALFIYARQHNLSFLFLADLLSPVLILGQALGRWGNYFNQEIFGKPTNLPWGIPINISNRPLDFLNFQYFHPCFFYEFILNLFIFIILFSLLKSQIKKITPLPGIVFSCYLVLYALVRFLSEFLRIDHEPMLLGLRLGQIFAIIGFSVGTSLLLKIKRHNRGIKIKNC